MKVSYDDEQEQQQAFQLGTMHEKKASTPTSGFTTGSLRYHALSIEPTSTSTRTSFCGVTAGYMVPFLGKGARVGSMDAGLSAKLHVMNPEVGCLHLPFVHCLSVYRLLPSLVSADGQ